MRLIVIGAHLQRDDIEPLAMAVPVGDIFLSALEIADEQPLGDRELLIRVAKVRGELLDRATFIAIRYGFTVHSESDAAQKVASDAAQWKRLLEENRDNVEMTLKVAATSPQSRPDRKDFTSGAEYLRALHASTSAASADPEFAKSVERLIVPRCLRSKWSHRDGRSLELAVLVSRSSVDELRGAAEELRRSSPGVPFLFSGPWPLEVFADVDHE
jgi:hypothetical protein